MILIGIVSIVECFVLDFILERLGDYVSGRFFIGGNEDE